MAELQLREPLIFALGKPGRRAASQIPPDPDPGAAGLRVAEIPAHLRRVRAPALPEVSELQVVRHFTRLSQLNFSIDSHFYPLGSCTMKYNPKACNSYAMLPEFLARHPLAPEPQGFLACMYELQEMLMEITGMQGVSLTPMAGAQGEFAGVAMIRAYHQARGDAARTEIIVPQAAHGTNPATAAMCGCNVEEIACDKNGDIDLEALKAAVGPATAGIMLTNPSTLGVFEHRIAEVARIVHEAGRSALLRWRQSQRHPGQGAPGRHGLRRHPYESAQDLLHPARRRRARLRARWASDRACCRICRFRSWGGRTDGYRWLAEADLPQSIGRLSGFMGNAGVQSARLHLHAHARPRGHGARRGVRGAQRELSDEATDPGGLRGGLSRSPREP